MILQEAVILRKTSIKNFYFFSHLMPLVSFYTLWQYKKCSGFVTFPGDIDRQIPVVWNGLIPANLNPLSDNPTKWSNTLKQFVGNLPTNCLSVFDHSVFDQRLFWWFRGYRKRFAVRNRLKRYISLRRVTEKLKNVNSTIHTFCTCSKRFSHLDCFFSWETLLLWYFCNSFSWFN